MAERNPYHDENGHYTSKDNNNGPCQHYPDSQNNNYERELAYNHKKCIQDAQKVFKKISEQGNYGTFDFNGNEITDRYKKPGYQVSCFRDEIWELLTPEEINEGINIIINYLNDYEYPDIGCFGKKPEISHYSINKFKAFKIAKIFNQAEVLSWKRTDSKDKYVIGDNAITNPYYDSKRKLTKEDYLKGFEELKNATRKH